MIYLQILYIIVIARVTDLLFKMIRDAYDATTSTPKEIMQAVSDSYDIRESLESIPSVDRVMLFNAHTTKHPKQLSDPIKITAIWGNPKSLSKINGNLVVDSQYMNILNNISKDKYYVYETSKEPDSLLKSKYEADGINKSIIFFLKYKRKRSNIVQHIFNMKGKRTGFYYISIASKDNKIFEGDTEVKIRESLAKLNSILSYE